MFLSFNVLITQPKTVKLPVTVEFAVGLSIFISDLGGSFILIFKLGFELINDISFSVSQSSTLIFSTFIVEVPDDNALYLNRYVFVVINPSPTSTTFFSPSTSDNLSSFITSN